MNEFLAGCRNVVGPSNVLTELQDKSSYLTDWRRRFTGSALAVIRPGTTEETAKIIRHCYQWKVPIVPQGGNTGLVLGSVPDESGTAIVLSLQRMHAIRDIDPINNTITVDAGCVLQKVQEAAAAAGRLFPLSLAAEGSCTIGGNLAVNAGGTAVLRYGTTRDLCLGLEVVTPQGDVWNNLRGLRKDNTGYDLRDLYIGAEGTLGIITAAVMKLFPQPAARLTAFIALETPSHALELLQIAQSRCGSSLTGFELMSSTSLTLVRKHFPQPARPFGDTHPQYVLMELSDSESEEHAVAMLESVTENAMERDTIIDAVVASSLSQSLGLWALREHISLAQAAEGKNIKHDVSLPISAIGRFIDETDTLLQIHFPGCRMVTFGHLGDGNLHYNVSAPVGVDDEAFIGMQSQVNQIVHDNVHRFGGSISAEHGIGALKRDEILRYKSPTEMQLMRIIKKALDPLGLMNPGKVL